MRDVKTAPAADEAQTNTVLTIGPGNARFTAVIYGKAARDESLGDLVGAQVQIRGVYGSYFNERRQLLGMRLLVTSRREILVDLASGGSPFSFPLRPVSLLMQYSANAESSSRAHVRGIVTLTAGPLEFAMQDQSAGLWVTGDGLPTLRLGDAVDVAGFTAQGAWNPVIEDAQVRVQRADVLPRPERLSIAEAFGGAHCFQRAQVEAELIQVSRHDVPAGARDASGRAGVPRPLREFKLQTDTAHRGRKRAAAHRDLR